MANYYPPFIRVWSPDGEVQVSIGQEGEGPGEFHGGVLDVFSTDEGSFFVLDRRRRRLSSFDRAGKLMKTIMFSGPYITAAAFSKAESAVYGAVRVRGSNGCRYSQVRRWRLADGGEATVVAEFPNAPVPRLMNCPAAVYNMDALPGGGVGVAFGYDEYLLTGFDSAGSVKYRVARDIARVPRTEEELEAEEMRIRRIGGDLLEAEADPQRSHFSGDSLRYDSVGRAWIRTERGREGETVFDVFSSGGTYMGEVVLPVTVKSPGTGFDVTGNYLLTIAVDDKSGTEFVKLWEAVWSGSSSRNAATRGGRSGVLEFRAPQWPRWRPGNG